MLTSYMWLVDTILGNTSYGIVPTSQKVLLFDTNLRGSLLRIFRIEILCVIKKETYKRRSLLPPSFFLLWKWYCEDMIHGTEAGLLRPQGKKHKGKLQNHRKKWKTPPQKNKLGPWGHSWAATQASGLIFIDYEYSLV